MISLSFVTAAKSNDDDPIVEQAGIEDHVRTQVRGEIT